MKKTVHLIIGLTLIATMSGCNSSPTEPVTHSTDQATVQSQKAEDRNEGTSVDPLGNVPAETQTEDATEFLQKLGVNKRGNVAVKPKEQAVFKDIKDEKQFAELTANNVTTNFKCTAKGALPPINGQYVALEFDVNANKEFAESGFPYFYLSVHDFRAWDAEGKRISDPVGNAETCIGEDERVPSPIDPGDSESGLVVFDVPKGSGTASFTMGGFQGSYGWEWSW